jgi:hypothetical protein
MGVRVFGIALLSAIALAATGADSAIASSEFEEAGVAAWYTGASPGTKL